MGKTITLFKGTTGLNNVVDPVRIMFDPESGMCELAEAYNVDIDISGRVSRREGLTATARTESAHSIFCDGGDCLYVSGTSLYKLNKDYSRTGLRSGLTTGAKMSYCQIADRIYYTNGFENGYVLADASYAWQASDYVGPVTTKVVSSPPVGHLLEYLSSRIYIALNDCIIYSEPFAYNWFAMASNFISLPCRPRMMRAVDDGLYVGLDDSVVFLGGKSPQEFIYTIVSYSPVVTGTDVKINGEKFGKGEMTGKLAMWTALDGIYLGASGGKVINLTKEKLVYSESQIGCSVFKDNKFITLLK